MTPKDWYVISNVYWGISGGHVPGSKFSWPMRLLMDEAYHTTGGYAFAGPEEWKEDEDICGHVGT